MRDAGREIDDRDLPPRLEWEAPVWALYERVATQWRVGFGGRYALDYNPAIALMQANGSDIELGLELLQVVERSIIDAENGRRQQDGKG